MKHLDLFSGIGGFALGLQRVGFETIAFCEIDKYCQLLLNEKWKGVKIYNDVKEITKEKFKADGIELPEIITGGFPCQPFSVAGKQKGTNDDRHLWPEMFRIIKELKPKWVIAENVRGLINIQDGVVFETVCTNLESEGYEVQTFNIPAAGVGAPHRRERIWIVANAKCNNETRKIQGSNGVQNQIQREHRQENSTSGVISGTSAIRQTDHGYEKNVATTNSGHVETGRERQGGVCGENTKERQPSNVTSSSETVADTNTRFSEQSNQEVQARGNTFNSSSTDVANTESSHRNDNEINSGNGESKAQEVLRDGSSIRGESAWWDFEPNVGRVANGLPGRVHRLKGLGNAIVPKIAEEIGKAIMKAEQ